MKQKNEKLNFKRSDICWIPDIFLMKLLVEDKVTTSRRKISFLGIKVVLVTGLNGDLHKNTNVLSN